MNKKKYVNKKNTCKKNKLNSKRELKNCEIMY